MHFEHTLGVVNELTTYSDVKALASMWLTETGSPLPGVWMQTRQRAQAVQWICKPLSEE